MIRDVERVAGGGSRRRRWLRAAALVAGLSAAFLYGYLADRKQLFPHAQLTWLRDAVRGQRPPGRWHETGAPEERRGDGAAARLRALPYLSGVQPAAGVSGVTAYDPETAYPGLNLYVSGHGTEALVIDMQGRPVHRWRLPPVAGWPEHGTTVEDPANPHWHFWRRAHPFPNGDLLVIYEGLGLVKIDADSNVLWADWGGAHHDLAVAEDGRIYVLTRRHRLRARYGPEPIVEDSITVLSAEGELIESVSMFEMLSASPYAALMDLFDAPREDVYHTNSIELLTGRLAGELPAFRAGNLLVSMRDLNAVAVVDLSRRSVVWALAGAWRGQHHPTLLANGNLLLFNNMAGENRSQVLELDPVTQEVAWDLAEGFYSYRLGAAYRLANGNTLIVESQNGRAIEVTPDRRIVWEFRSPHRAGKDQELVAVLCDLVRLESDFLPGAARRAFEAAP